MDFIVTEKRDGQTNEDMLRKRNDKNKWKPNKVKAILKKAPLKLSSFRSYQGYEELKRVEIRGFK